MTRKSAHNRPVFSAAPQAGGFYTRYLQPDELEDLAGEIEGGLSGEIAMLRAAARRLFALAHGADDAVEAASTLGALGLACTRLAGLLKTQRLLNAHTESDLAQSISQALAEVIEEMGIKKPGGA